MRGYGGACSINLQRMKICFLAHNLKRDNGGGTLAYHVATGLRDALSAEVIALTYEPSGTPFERVMLRFGKWGVMRGILSIRAIIKTCDAVHAFDLFPYGIYAALASLGLRKKLLITLVGTGSVLPLYRPFFSWFAVWSLRRADQLVAISRFTRNEVQKKVPGISITVITPALAQEDFALASAREELSDAVRRYRPYLVSVGALRKRKGYEVSVRAFAHIAAEFPSLSYVIVGKRGSRTYDERLKKLIGELHLEERVRMVDSVETREELYEWYRGAELFCLFSRNDDHDIEGFGIVFLEAAACGLPVVGTKQCGIDDAVSEEQNGLLVAGDDSEPFAQAILRILRDPALKARMAEEGRAWAAQFTWDERVERYLHIYRANHVS